MKYILTILLVSSALLAKPCGWDPDEDGWYFYNIVNQTIISSEAYYPFLKDETHAFFNVPNSNSKIQDSGNIILWKVLLESMSEDDIRKALYTDSDVIFHKLWKDKTSKNEIASKSYIQYARECSKLFEYRKEFSWDYNEILKTKSFDINTLLQKGVSYFNNEKNLQLKMRYAYQIIRLFHYSKKYQDAVDFFTNKIETNFDKNELYWYISDQVAGCYYSLNDFDKAAFMFLKVFNNSIDRKVSAFTSYNFCNNKGADGSIYIKDLQDQMTYTLIKSIKSFSDEIFGLKEMYKLDPGDPKIELLFMRTLNGLERNLWPKYLGLSTKVLPSIDDQTKIKILELLNFAELMVKSNKITNKEFWILSASYLSFLKGNLNMANQYLTKITGKKFQSQKNSLQHIYTVFSWDKMTDLEEKYIADLLKDFFTEGSDNYWNDLTQAWKYLLLDQTAHLYYKNNQQEKAFLIHNRIESADQLSSLELINKLISFTDKKNKNSFEQLLLTRTQNIRYNCSAKDYLYFLKGLYFLQKSDYTQAYTYLNKSSLNQTAIDKNVEISGIESLVTGRIFSNNIKECFNCSEEDVMVDSVFLASVFSFIKPKFSKAELAEYLLKLDSLTRDSKTWKRKVAHYLLGNYYFNISNTGYYRGTLSGRTNCCSYTFFSIYNDHKGAEELIRDGTGYNLYNIESRNKTYFKFADKAQEHYEKVVSLSQDKELNARCLYMTAKCELNKMYNSGEYSYSGYYDYNGGVTDITKKYKSAFKQLNENYSDTKFYKMILKECSFFRIYCSL